MADRAEEKLSLVDMLAQELGCQYLSDLGFLQKSQRAYLAGVIQDTPLESATLFEWNDALAYLAEAPPQEDAAEAKQWLLSALTSEDTQKS